MSKKSILEAVLSKWSYRLNSQKYLVELSFAQQPVLVFHLKGLKAFTDAVFTQNDDQEVRLAQVASAFLNMYEKRYPTAKKSIKDFKPAERENFLKIFTIIDSLNQRYPQAALTPQRYMRLHFLFYQNNFNTVPKTNYFVTDNAIIRTDNLLTSFNGRWPGDKEVEDYFANNLSPASPKATSRAKEIEATPHDPRLAGLQIWATNSDRDTPLKDNQKFKAAKARVLNKSATIYEARYVWDCYHVRSATDQMPHEIGDYIDELEDLALKLGVKLK